MLAESPVIDDFDLAEGQRLASLELAAPQLDGYEVLGLIGEGTYGDVWKARDQSSGVIVAIKRLRRQPDAQSCAEVEKLARLSSVRGIVTLRQVHLAAEPYCYVMEHLEGGTLGDLIRRERQLPFADAWRIYRQLNEALAYVHSEGIVHCDIKPENILLDARGNPRLGDFGQARGRGPGGAALGTRFYMSPEQARLEGLPDPRWDVYALGAVLYEMLTGIKPRFDTEVSSLMSAPTGSGSEVRDRLEKYARHLERCPPPQLHRKVKGVDSATARLIDDSLSIEFSDRPEDAAAMLKRIGQCEHARASKPLLVFGGLAPAIMLLAVALVLWAVGSSTLSSLERYWKELIHANNPIIAQSVGSEVESLFNAQAEIVRQEASDPALFELFRQSHGSAPGGGLRSADSQTQFDQRLEAIHARHKGQVYRWSLARADGMLVANYGGLPGAGGSETVGIDRGSNGKNYAWRGWFNGVIDRAESLDEPRDEDLADFRRRLPRQAFVAQPYSRKGDNQFVVIAVSCPVAAEGAAQPAGVISGMMAYDQFFTQMQATASRLAGAGQQIVIVNDQQQVLFHSDREAWQKSAGESFVAPRFADCQHFKAALAADAQPTTKSTEYIDPVNGRAYWGAAHVVKLPSGQRLAIFVQQQNRISPLWSRASWLAAALLVVGVVFLGTNSYALYWTLRQSGAATRSAGASAGGGHG
ncbi:MAG: serine/threonine protein kinase [Planctomycetaceae bacterium]|nr:serine/threonine protein kinase [Planctomycetaceae bacterium]